MPNIRIEGRLTATLALRALLSPASTGASPRSVGRILCRDAHRQEDPMSTDSKPKLLWLRFLQPKLPSFVQLHMREQELCMSQFFDLAIVNERSCDYQQLCDQHEPDLAIFETGVYTVPAEVTNTGYSPQIPRLGFVHCDAYCPTRKTAIANMARWGVSAYFGISVSMGEYTPSLAGDLFVWPNFVNPELYRDYGLAKVVPVLFSGSQASHYPWRSRIDRIVSGHYPSLHSPHFGWCWKKKKPATSGFLQGERYARLINSAFVAPTCGTIAKEVVRKHFEIPACNTCLLTEKTAGLEAAGFEDMVNCVYTNEDDVLDKLEWLFENPAELERITAQGKELVDARHTIRHRSQVHDWFTLHRQLKPGQRVVQPGPFEPMRIAEVRSGETKPARHRRRCQPRAVRPRRRAPGRGRLQRGGASLSNRPELPPAAHSRPYFLSSSAANFIKGRREALATLREHFPSHLSNSEHGFEPGRRNGPGFCSRSCAAASGGKRRYGPHNSRQCVIQSLIARVAWSQPCARRGSGSPPKVTRLPSGPACIAH